MITLDSVNTSLTGIFENFDNILTKVDIFTEASLDEYKINLKEADLKVMQEDGTAEDLMYLEAAAKDSLWERTKKTISALIERFKEFVKKIKVKVTDFFAEQTTKNAISKTESSVKKYPELKDIKIKVKDPESITKEYDGVRGNIQKFILKLRTGKVNSADIKAFEKDKAELENDGSKIKKRVSVVTVTLASAVGLVKAARDKICKDKYEDVKWSPDKNVDTEEHFPLITEACRAYYSSWRFKLGELVMTIINTLKDIKRTISDKLSGVVKESSSDDRIRDIYSRLYTEGGKKDDDDSDDDSEDPEDDEKKKKSEDDEDDSAEDDEAPEDTEDDDDSEESDDDEKDNKSKSKKSKKKGDEDSDDESDDSTDDEESEDEESTTESSFDDLFFGNDDESVTESVTDDLDDTFNSFFGDDTVEESAKDLFDQMDDMNFFED